MRLAGLLAIALVLCAPPASAAPGTEEAAPGDQAAPAAPPPEAAAAASAPVDVDADVEHEVPETETPTEEEPIPGRRYTADLDEEALEKIWKEDPASLGPLSIGFADAGRLVNAVRFPEGPLWTLLDPERQYTTPEVIAYLTAAIEEVNAIYPDVQPLRVGHISRKDGGWLRPHISHQAGRDVDLCFYETPEPTKRGDRFDVARNWALLRSLIIRGDVQFVLLDKRLIKRLWDYALSIGEDKDWLESLFHSGMGSLVFHARRHRDHFHVRYFSPRAQELGRRIQPLLPKGKPEYNVVVHRVRSGENLGSIARKYDTTVSALKKANKLSSTLIRAGATLSVPTGTACVECPVPPEVVVPPRRLPPTTPEVLEPRPREIAQAEPGPDAPLGQERATGASQ